jgi:predicted acylesterase/phospholipase RssA
MSITSLVMSSGGTNGYLILGAIEVLTQNKHIDLNNITSMYTTSAGSLIGVLLSIEKNVDIIRDYMLNFPIKNIIKYDVDSIVEFYNHKGIFGEDVILKLFKSFFDSENISHTITLREFYEYSGIEHHIFTFDFNSFKVIDISYKTHPNLSLVTASYASSAVPVLFKPIFIDGMCCVDGGVGCAYPMYYAIKDVKNESEIVGIDVSDLSTSSICMNGDTDIIEYTTSVVGRILQEFLNTSNFSNVGDMSNNKNILQFKLKGPYVNNESCNKCINNIDKEREVLFNMGKEQAIKILKELQNKENDNHISVDIDVEDVSNETSNNLSLSVSNEVKVSKELEVSCEM